MSMLDALRFAQLQQEQRAAAEHARAAVQEGVQAMQRARDELLARQMAEAASTAPEPTSDAGQLRHLGQPESAPLDAGPLDAGIEDSRIDSPETRAHDAHACADRDSLSFAVPNGTIEFQPPGHYDTVIRELAIASLPFGNKEAWTLLLAGGKARGLQPVEIVNLRPAIWRLRKALKKRDMQRLRDAARAARVDLQ